jgi:hypothetical protein
LPRKYKLLSELINEERQVKPSRVDYIFCNYYSTCSLKYPIQHINVKTIPKYLQPQQKNKDALISCLLLFVSPKNWLDGIIWDYRVPSPAELEDKRGS